MNFRCVRSVALAAVTSFAVNPVCADVVRIVREPRQVASVMSRTESAWATCKWCAKKISYNRTYRWDVYDRKWVETTEEVPALCRKCEAENKRYEKLRREEEKLDRKISWREAKKRVAEKRQANRDWTYNNK